jgi:hypothetical protein
MNSFAKILPIWQRLFALVLLGIWPLPSVSYGPAPSAPGHWPGAVLSGVPYGADPPLHDYGQEPPQAVLDNGHDPVWCPASATGGGYWRCRACGGTQIPDSVRTEYAASR